MLFVGVNVIYRIGVDAISNNSILSFLIKMIIL